MNNNKFQELIIYILNRVGGRPNVGETVLYKLLYFCDFNFYEIQEEFLTGAKYYKRKYGPVPKDFKKCIEKMKKNKDLEEVDSEHFKYPQKKYLAHREANLDIFSANEIKVIDSVLNSHGKRNAKFLSDYSHRDVPWVVTKDNQIIDYETVFYRTPEHSVKEYNFDKRADN
ncbi:MAG: Panacea domain-containing protein [Pseudomonadota bacterium]